MQIAKMFESRPQTRSFEFFPPKTEKGLERFYRTVDTLAGLSPDFMTVTCGAAGGNRDRTVEIAAHIERETDSVGVAHVTCSWATVPAIREMLDEARDAGIRNVLALRGDPPKGEDTFSAVEGGFRNAHQLVRMIRDDGYPFSVGVGGYPEMHPEAESADADLAALKHKVDQGADFIITQMFFDNAVYTGFVERARAAGIECRILPGIMPIANYHRIREFCSFCGATMPERLHELMGPIADDPEAVREAGARYAAEQITELLAAGAPGFHLYVLNKADVVSRIYKLLEA